MPHELDGNAQRDRFLALLNASRERANPIRFWWRDDDAEAVTPPLDRLLQLARRHDLPLALAVVPKRATEDLAARLADEPKVAVLQHGWSHRNHAPEGEKSMELGDHRPLPIVLSDLRQGFARLTTLVSEKFRPVLVPPWNRVSNSVRGARSEIGLAGLSTFGPVGIDDPHWVNVHLDIFEWRPARRPLTRNEAYAILCSEVERRLAGDAEPIGIMTHHLVHEEESWDFLDEFFGLVAKHPAVAWPTAEELFGLSHGSGRGLRPPSPPCGERAG